MIRDTSREAYRILIEEGKLSKRRAQVYEYLYFHGPRTQPETREHFNDKTSSFSPRFAELENMGLIKAVGKTTGEQTGHTNTLFDVTTRIVPIPLPKNKTRKDSKKEVLEAMRNLWRCLKGDEHYIGDPLKEVERIATKIKEEL